MTLAAATLNFLGGLPDRAFARTAGLLRKSCPVSEAEYLRSLAFYKKFKSGADVKSGGLSRPSLDFFELPKKAPQLSLKKELKLSEGSRRTFSFRSGYKVKNPAIRSEFELYERNANAYMHLWQHETKKLPPLVLCLHGFLLGKLDVAEKMFRISKLFGSGVDVGLFILPHHGERTDFFFNQKLMNPENVPLSVEGVAQTQHDLHATMLALKQMGYVRIGLIGASLGGFAAITYVTLSDLAEFLFTVVPAIRMQDYLLPDQKLFSFPVTEKLRELTAMTLELVTPEHWQPQIPVHDICTVIHAGDKLNDSASARGWIQAWHLQSVVEVTGGHWLYFDKSARGKAWYSWLKQKKFFGANTRKTEASR